MFCGECGTENPETNSFCKNCGKTLRKPAAPGIVPGTNAPPVVQQPAVQPGTQGPAAAIKQPWSLGKKFALGSIIFGIIAFLYAPYIAALMGIILGALALKNKTMTGAIGVVLSIAAVIVNNLALVLLSP